MVCSPQDFGAIEGTDATSALQAFFDHITANDVGTADVHGSYLVSGPVTWGDQGAPGRTLNATGTLSLQATAPMDTILLVINQPQMRHEGVISVRGTGGVSYAARTCRVGLRITGSPRSQFSTVRARNVYGDGVVIDSLDGNATTLVDVRNVRASDCGSGTVVPRASLTAAWSAPANSGTSGSTAQSTVFTVDILPPEAVTSARPLLVNIGGELYQVVAVDRDASAVQVFPWLNPAVGSTGTLTYLFGAGVRVHGSDAGIIGLGQVDAMRCGIGLTQAALYGPIAHRVVTQFCGAGLTIGGHPGNASVTLSVDGFYCESNVVDVARLTRYGKLGARIAGYAVNPAKCVNLVAPRLTSGALSVASEFAGFEGISIDFGDGPQAWAKPGGNAVGSTIALDVTVGRGPVTYRRDTLAVTLLAPDLDMNRLYGHDSTQLIVHGSGPAGQPTGSIRFTPPPGFTVNGQATVERSGFVRPPLFSVLVDIAALNFLVADLAGNPL